MSNQEPLAIVGIGCRFPGGTNTPEAFWHLLINGVDAISEVPPERWNAARFYHPEVAAPGRMVTRWGGFVENIDKFDAAFFGIAPREAARMDPQHRWLAEVTWEALEDAGLPPEDLSGSRTGVFIGISASDYSALRRHEREEIDAYSNIGSTLSIAANRLSFLFNLRGPSMAVDTACSSSLVALHLAAQSLWRGECDHAVVGGASALLAPDASIGFSHAGMLSPSGRCRAFDAAADGYVRSEGAAAILLMPSSTAEALGVHARALVLGTASNQDGHTSSLTVPNQRAQEEVIREALTKAAAHPRDVVYAEAHGTGTAVGDPIEARALAAVLVENSDRETPLFIGSVKTNIGHMEPVSGLAGLIKSVLMLEHGTIPPSLHFTERNPLVPAELEVRVETIPLTERTGAAPLIAVNSFGFGGTNAHALLSPASPRAVPIANQSKGPCILPISARDPQSLVDYAAAYAKHIREDCPYSLTEICGAAALGKSHHPIREAFVAESMDDLAEQLTRFSLADCGTKATPGKLAFVFAGQGSQWRRMGRELYHAERIVRETWEECDAICRNLGGPALLDALLTDEEALHLTRTEIAQPVLFALQASQVALWRSWGMTPDMVIGHSVGEAAACWAAGAYDMEDILRLVLIRSRLQARANGRGRMLACGISEGQAREWESQFPNQIWIAAINAPSQATLSGEAPALDEIAARLKNDGIFHRFVGGDYAFHSGQMDEFEAEIRSQLSGLEGHSSKIPMVSTVTGEPIAGDQLTADYWWRNVREPVRFSSGIDWLLRAGCTTFIEIGPHPVLASAIAETALNRGAGILHVPSMHRERGDATTMRQAAATLYRAGFRIQWSALVARPGSRIRLPRYPWQRQRLWQESQAIAHELRSSPSHPLLGDRQADPQPVWLNRLDARLVPWLAEHRLADSAVLPAAAYIEMAAAAVRELLDEPIIFLENIRFRQLLFLHPERPVQTSVRLDSAASSFKIYARALDGALTWQLQAEGLFRPGRLRVPPLCDLDQLRALFSPGADPVRLYRELSDIGQSFGPVFQAMRSVQTREGEALSLVENGAERDSQRYILFPPLFDACFHSLAALRTEQDRGRRSIIEEVRQVRIFQPASDQVCSHVRISERGEILTRADVTITDPTGAIVAEIDGLAVRSMRAETAPGRERKCYELVWEAEALSESALASSKGAVLIVADDDANGRTVADSFASIGMAPTVVSVSWTGRIFNHGSLNADLRDPRWAAALWESLAARGTITEHVIFLWEGRDVRACSALLALVQGRQAAAEDAEVSRWLIVTRQAQAVDEGTPVHPEAATLWGFGRTMQTERPNWQISLMDYDGTLEAGQVAGELLADHTEPEVALRSGERLVRRLKQLQLASAPEVRDAPAFALQLGEQGKPDSLAFRGQARRAPMAGEVEVEIAAAGLNFRDVMKVLGVYPALDGAPVTLGDEFSGRVLRVGRGVRKFKAGDRVVGFAPSGGAFASHLVLSAQSVWQMPEHLGFSEAASIPVAFGTAYHALHNLARLRRGETVLIHAAAGGVGLAAVQLAMEIGAVVFATAGSAEKRDYLRNLGVTHVMDSRTLDFAAEIMRLTGGCGVDVVLNSLAGAFQQVSLTVCAPLGRFVEIGKRDIAGDSAMPLGSFARSLSFYAFDLGAVLASDGAEKNTLSRFLSHGASRRKPSPLPATTFPATDAISAFRLMQSAGHIGKIVLKFDASDVPEVPAEFLPRPNATYLITGGFSGFGLATARWLADRGATHLALLSRTGAPSPQDAQAITELRSRGVAVYPLRANVAKAQSLASALKKLAGAAPPLAGIFQAAMVLSDVEISKMTTHDLEAVLAPKVAGAWNLHLQTREMPLDCFVMYSSLSSLIGTAGQANYAAANAFMDALAHHRRRECLRALSVNWGHISDTGFAARHSEIGRYLGQVGVRGIASQEALQALNRLLVLGAAQAGVMEIDWEKLGRASGKFEASPMFRDLVQAGRERNAPLSTGAEWRAAMLRLAPDARSGAVLEMVTAQLAVTLGMPRTDIDPARPLANFGIDSLMAVELKARIQGFSGQDLPYQLFNAELTAHQLAERLVEILSPAAGDAPSVAATPRPLPAKKHTATPLFRTEPTPFADLIRAGSLPPLAAAAVMTWPELLMEQLNLPPESFFRMMNGNGVSFPLILETQFGSVGVFMLPLSLAQINPQERALLPRVLDGIKQASASGAQCVTLTGAIPLATDYGADVQAAMQAEGKTAALTTGHATSAAALVLNLEGLLRSAGRDLQDESVMFHGIGSIGTVALRLMLEVLPHPAGLRLYDPYRGAVFFTELVRELRHDHGFAGAITIDGSSSGDSACYEASVIIGATNVENSIDVARLAPGTVVLDDSWPHCLNGPAALARFRKHHDILMTEGGFVRNQQQMPRITHLPAAFTDRFSADLPNIFFSSLDPRDITPCVLSALLSAQRPDLPPTLGRVDTAAARRHWLALRELGFTSVPLSYEGNALDPHWISQFRQRFGKAAVRDPVLAAVG